MEHENYERELKYLLAEESDLSFEEILQFFDAHQYRLIETRLKKKNEAYYDEVNLSFIKKGDVIRASTHINEKDTYFHFMYKKNVSDHNKPYVSKFEFGSGQFVSVQEFIARLGINVNIQQTPVLYAEMERETAIVEKELHRLLISYDKVKYYKKVNTVTVCEKMLEIEDWTTPNTITNADNEYDAHLHNINELLLNSRLPLQLTTNSKPFRGLTILSEKGYF